MKKANKIFLISFLCLSILLISIWTVLFFFINSQITTGIIEKQVNKTITGSLSLKRHKLSLLSGELVLYNSILKSSLGHNIAGFKRLYIKISLFQLLRHTIKLSKLHIDDLFLEYVLYPNGQSNILEAVSLKNPSDNKKGSGESKPFNFIISSLKLKKGILKFRSIKDTMSVVIDNINLKARGNLFEQSGIAKLSIGTISFESPIYHTVIDTFSSEVSLSDTRISITEFLCASSFSKIHIDINGNIENTFKDPDFDISGNIHGKIQHVLKNYRDTLPLSGTLSTQIDFKGSLAKPDIHCSLSYSDGSVYSYRIDNLFTKISIKEHAVNVEKLLIEAPFAKLFSNISFKIPNDLKWKDIDSLRKLNAAEYNVILSIDSIDLKKVLSNGDSIKGYVNTDISLEGKGITPESIDSKVDLLVGADRISTQGISKPIDGKLILKTVIRNGKIQINRCSLNTDYGNISVQGMHNLLTNNLDLNLVSDTIHLKNLLALFVRDKVSGKVKIAADITGQASYPNIALDLKGKNINYSQYNIESVSMECSADSSGVIDSIALLINNKRSNFNLTGSAALFNPKSFVISKNPLYKIFIDESILYIEDFVDSLKGKISFFVDAKSNLDSASGMIDISAQNLDFGVQKFDTLALNGTLRGKKLIINPLTVYFPETGKITLQGWVSNDRQYNFSLKSNDIPLTAIQKIDELNNINGSAHVNISGEGSLDTPSISGNLLIANPSVNKKQLEDLSIQLELKEKLFSLTGKSDYTFNGKYNLDKKHYSINVSFDSTCLSPYFAMFGQKDINGFIKGTITIDGQDTLLNNAYCNIDNLQLFYKMENLLSSQNLKINYKGGQFNAPDFNIKILDKGFFTLKGNYIADDAYSLDIMGDIPFNIIEVFSPQISEAKGNIHIGGTIRGKDKIPEIKAEIALQEIAFSVPDLAQKITSINGAVQVFDNVIRFKGNGVRGNIDEGDFTLFGKIDLDSLKPSDFSLSLDLNAVPVNLPDMLDITFDSDIKMNGTMEKATIEGGITILDGLYYKDISGLSYNEMLFSLLKGLIGDSNEEINTTDTAKVNPFMENTGLNIKVSSNNPFIVDNNMALMEIKPDLTIKGNLNTPIITGRAELPYGTITYQKKEFIVNKGIIDFTNPYVTEPNIDIESEVEIQEYKIYLIIRGIPPDKIQITLDSDPYLSDDNKLSLLIFGKLRKDIINGNGFSYQSTEEILNNIIGSKVKDNIKNATGFDVDIETDLLSDQDDRIKVTIGKDISKRLNTEYSFETVGGNKIQKATLKYKLFENIQLKGFNDTEGNYGGEIEFFFDKR